MNALKKLFGGNTRQFGMIFALVALIVFFQIATDGLHAHLGQPDQPRSTATPTS